MINLWDWYKDNIDENISIKVFIATKNDNVKKKQLTLSPKKSIVLSKFKKIP